LLLHINILLILTSLHHQTQEFVSIFSCLPSFIFVFFYLCISLKCVNLFILFFFYSSSFFFFCFISISFFIFSDINLYLLIYSLCHSLCVPFILCRFISFFSFLSSCFLTYLLCIYGLFFIDYTEYEDTAKDTELYYKVLSDVIYAVLHLYSQGTSFGVPESLLNIQIVIASFFSLAKLTN
jgi:hypothetical protein